MTDTQLKHLELIQGVIARMAQSSFVIKGWTLTLVSALLALSAKDTDPSFAALPIFPGVVFWCLDGYYLMLERRYRALYEDAAAAPPPTLSLSIQKYEATETWASAMLSRSVLPLYVAIVALSAVIAARAMGG